MKAPKGWFQRLDPDLVAALEAYQDGGFKDINYWLRRSRSDPVPPRFGTATISKILNQIEDITDAINQAPALDHRRQVYRGLKHWPGGQVEGGAIVTFKGFTSTTLSSSQAAAFMGNPDWVLLQIDLPIGTRGVWLEGLGGEYADQEEFLLPHETRMVVTTESVQPGLLGRAGRAQRVIEGEVQL